MLEKTESVIENGKSRAIGNNGHKTHSEDKQSKIWKIKTSVNTSPVLGQLLTYYIWQWNSDLWHESLLIVSNQRKSLFEFSQLFLFPFIHKI